MATNLCTNVKRSLNLNTKELNVNVHFALPYNAQTKPVERDFLKIKELLSKHCVGYRGGNVVERPEKLAKEIKDGKFQTTYWADWMIHKKGMKVYLRRDIKNYKEAWVFNAKNDEFLGKAEAVKSVAALYAPEVSKEEFEAAVATKKRNIKITKAYIKQNKDISAMEKYQNYETAYQSVEREYKKPVKVSKIANTSMDKAIQKNKDMESYGKADLSIFLPEKEKKKFYHWETEKYLDEPEEELYLYETDRIIAEQQKKRC